ncbi:unnamed protein product [Echinostoma caproni]|uniref:Uncharacterized protein n=1 Tax=Echinostoma caproni TaxID=27848 RepID=A0A183A7H0_9TREM|nr:unnamed protein product [Echinostoma caproni]
MVLAAVGGDPASIVYIERYCLASASALPSSVSTTSTLSINAGIPALALVLRFRGCSLHWWSETLPKRGFGTGLIVAVQDQTMVAQLFAVCCELLRRMCQLGGEYHPECVPKPTISRSRHGRSVGATAQPWRLPVPSQTVCAIHFDLYVVPEVLGKDSANE